jgi:Fe-S oxidoreductase
MQLQLPKLNPVTLHYFENCVGCGVCAPSCPYFYVDEKYAPVEKAEVVRTMLRKKYTLSGKILGPLVGAGVPKSPEDLRKLLNYAYMCTNCGHCYVVCPFGIDSGAVVRLLRQTLYSSGVAPAVLKKLAEAEGSGHYLNKPAVKSLWDNFLKAAEAPVGRKGANVLLFVSVSDLVFARDAVLSAVKILKHVGEDFTLPERPLGIRPPLADVVGDAVGVRQTTLDIVSYIEGLSPKAVVVVDGGHVYPYLRFEASNILKKRLSFRVLHFSELLYEYLKQGRLKLKKLGVSAAWHDPCQLGRRGGVFEEPREVLKHAVDLKELPRKSADAICSGGCETAYLTEDVYVKLLQLLEIDPRSVAEDGEYMKKVEDAYRIAVRRKMEEIKKAGVKHVITACPMSAYAMRLGGKLYGVEVEVEDFAVVVAKALE